MFFRSHHIQRCNVTIVHVHFFYHLKKFDKPQLILFYFNSFYGCILVVVVVIVCNYIAYGQLLFMIILFSVFFIFFLIQIHQFTLPITCIFFFVCVLFFLSFFISYLVCLFAIIITYRMHFSLRLVFINKWCDDRRSEDENYIQQHVNQLAMWINNGER